MNLSDHRNVILLIAYIVAVILLIIGLSVYGVTMPNTSKFYMQMIYSGIFKLHALGTATIVYRLHRKFHSTMGCLIYILIMHILLNTIVLVFCFAFEEYTYDLYQPVGFFKVNESFCWRWFFIVYIITVSYIIIHPLIHCTCVLCSI